jgi:endonuclease YncB( thermonuclease family)
VAPVRLTLAALVAVAAGCGGGGESAPAGPSETGVVRVVVDGDTLRLEDGRRVRLLQIDAPEEASECYGRAATRELIRLAGRGEEVVLARDPALDDRDGGGRLLRYLTVDGRVVNLELVARGAAAPYFFRNARGRYAADLLEASREARDGRRGFWAACPGARLEPALGSLTGPA